MEEIFNQVLLVQSEEQICAKPYERTDYRTAYRNGFRDRQLTTLVGHWTYVFHATGTVTLARSSLSGTSAVNRHWSCPWWKWWSMASPPEKSKTSLKNCAAESFTNLLSSLYANEWIHLSSVSDSDIRRLLSFPDGGCPVSESACGPEGQSSGCWSLLASMKKVAVK